MPDLSLEASHDYWESFEGDPSVEKVIKFMEAVEGWTHDGDPEIEAAMIRLEKALEDIVGVEISNQAMLVQLGAYLKTSRVLRIMQEIDTHNRGAATKLLNYAESQGEDDKASRLFIRRNLIFERLRLLSRVFSAERLETIQNTLERMS